MSQIIDSLQFPTGIELLLRWQQGDIPAQDKLREIFDAAIAGQLDYIFQEPASADTVWVTTSLHLLTLTIMNQMYGLNSAEFYKGDPQRYVRTTLLTQRLLGIRKLTLGWPVYAFGAASLEQATMYPEKHAPGAAPEKPLVDRTNWRNLDIPDLEHGIPRLIEDMLNSFAKLTGLEPVSHLPAPYSLAADIFGQEKLIAALLESPSFIEEFLGHLTDRIFAPWIDRLVQRVPRVWVELSDASGSPMFISPHLFKQVAARPVRRLIHDYPWGNRVFVANYRGDPPVTSSRARPARRTAGRRYRKKDTPKPDAAALEAMIEFKLSVCPEFIIKLDADQAPVSFYVEQAIQRGKPLYLGFGATRIDRNSIVDRPAAERELTALTTEYVQAIKTVSEALARAGHPRASFAWPGDVYIEDINAETDLGLVKTIVETTAKYGSLS